MGSRSRRAVRSLSSNGSPVPRPTLVYGAYTPVTKALWAERLKYWENDDSTLGLAEPVDKPPQFFSTRYNFTTDYEILEMYRNPWDRIRIGRVLEDLDSMAGNIAFAHCDDGEPSTRAPLLVTAAVERIQMLRPVDLTRDVNLGGQVVYTGRTSIDIRLCLEQDGAPGPSLIALFTFVARDPLSQQAAPVNRLVPRTDEERAWFREREAAAKARKAARSDRRAPVDDRNEAGDHSVQTKRSAWAARMLAEARARHVMPGLSAGDALLMDDTLLSNTFTCQPQQRNMHGRIFGGFLMRRAYELAYATTHMFAGRRPRFVEVDRVDFTRPVDVGDLVTFQSRVLHTRNLLDHPDGPKGVVWVEVEATVNRPEVVTSATTNRFMLTFEINLAIADGDDMPSCTFPRMLKRVLPANEYQSKLAEQFYPLHYTSLDG